MEFIDFPSELPAARAGTQFELEQPLYKGIDGARESYALISPFVPVYLTVEWILTDEQAHRFEQFYQDDLADGMLGFAMPVLVPAGRLSARCRFLGVYEGPKLFSMPHAKERLWICTARIEMQQRIFVDVLTSKGVYTPIMTPEQNQASAVLNTITTRRINIIQDMQPEMNEASAVLNTITHRNINKKIGGEDGGAGGVAPFYDHSQGSAVLNAISVVKKVVYTTYVMPPEDKNEASAVIDTITHVRKARYSTIEYQIEDKNEASAVLNTITVVRK